MLGSSPRSHDDCLREADLWTAAYLNDYRQCIAVGQIRVHKDTCFKYVVHKGVKKAKHCRLHFCHFVSISVRQMVDGVSRVRDVAFARTGKDLVLPRRPGQAAPPLAQVDCDGQPQALKPTCALGPTVIADDARGLHGRVQPIRWHPLEGSYNGAAQVGVRGNTDFQSMMCTFPDGFTTDSGADRLWGTFFEEADACSETHLRCARFEAELPSKTDALAKWRRSRRMPVNSQHGARAAQQVCPASCSSKSGLTVSRQACVTPRAPLLNHGSRNGLRKPGQQHCHYVLRM